MPFRPFRRSPRLAVSALFFFNGGLFGGWAARVPSIKAALDIGEGTLGLLLLAAAAGAILSFPLAGRLTDSIGAARTSRLVAVLYAPSLPALALASEPWHLALLLFVFGATHGGMDISMNAWGAEVERARGRSTMVSFHAMWSLGAGVGAGVGALAIASGLSVGAHFTVHALLLAGPTLWLASVPWQSRMGRGRKAPLIALPRGALVWVGVLGLCAMIGEGAIADWGALLLIERLAADEARAVLAFSFFSVAMVAMRLAGDRIVARLGPVRVARIGGAVTAAGTVLILLAPSVEIAWIGFAVTGAGTATIAPLVYARAARDPVIPPGAALAGVSTLGYGSLFIGPPLIGAIAEVASLTAGFWVLVGMALLVVALAGALRSPAS